MKTWTDKSRREWIERRRRESFTWQVIHALGSLRLAMILLLTIALACAIATITESRFDTKVAQTYVYKAPWFIFWLAVLCINLFSVTLTRWPWQRKHAGFIVTHYGIIILLIGAVVGQKTGFEAGVTLQAGQPTSRLVLNKTILQVDNPSDGATYTMPFEVDVRPPTPDRPRIVPLPGTDLRLRVDDYSESLVLADHLVPAPGAGPGVALELSSGMMTQHVHVTLASQPAAARSNDFFGRARIELVDALPDRSGATEATERVSESQMLLPGHDPVVQTHEGAATGYRASLKMELGVPRIAITSPRGGARTFDLAALREQPARLEKEAIDIAVAGYWPDFVMKDGVPSTASNQPNRPAVLINLSGTQPDAARVAPLFELAPAPGGAFAYQISRGGVVTVRGTAKEGDRIATGWADWQALVHQIVPEAMLVKRIQPAEEGTSPTESIPGIHAALGGPGGDAGQAEWIGSGRLAALTAGDHTVRIGFGLQVRNIPFAVELLDFEVPRDEGTTTPADFISTVRFREPNGGRTMDAVIHMNHPASYPPETWRALTGMGYKFSQASWNPENLDETTLQVLHDPGWLLKWIGSLLICIGITIMFYLKPRPQPGQAASAPARPRKRELAATDA